MSLSLIQLVVGVDERSLLELLDFTDAVLDLNRLDDGVVHLFYCI